MDQFLLEDLPPMQGRDAGVVIGRFQPATIGHASLINKASKVCRERKELFNLPIVVVVDSEKYDSRNPLTGQDRIKMLKSGGLIDPKIKFLIAKNAFDALVKVREAGYEPKVIFVGSDRAKNSPYEKILDSHFTDDNGNKLRHKTIEIPRDAISEYGEQAIHKYLDDLEKTDEEAKPGDISGTLAREAVKLGYKNAFSKITGLSPSSAIFKLVFRKLKEMC